MCAMLCCAVRCCVVLRCDRKGTVGGSARARARVRVCASVGIERGRAMSRDSCMRECGSGEVRYWEIGMSALRGPTSRVSGQES